MKYLILILLFSCSPEIEEMPFEFTVIENIEKDYTKKVADEINFYRSNPIEEDPNNLVFYLAYKHSERGVLDHDGYFERSLINKNNTPFIKVGEVIGYGYDSPEQLVYAWVNSETHRDVIFGNYNKIVIAKHNNFVTALLLR